MKRSFVLCLVSLFIFESVAAQPSVHLLNSAKEIDPAALATRQSLVFSVDEAALQEAYASPHFIATGMRIPAAGGTITVSLDVTEFSVFGPETRFVEQHGVLITDLPLPEVKTYRGQVVGKAGSLAYLSMTPNGKVSGLVRIDNEEFTIGYPKGEPMTSMITPEAAIPNASDRARCEMTDERQYDMHNTQRYLAERAAGKFAAPQSVQTATKTAVVAFDADYACEQSYGGVQEVTDYLTSCVGAITTVYESEIDMALQIGTVKVWTSDDPYSGGDLNSLLASFTSIWPSLPGNSDISRTMTHLLDNKLGAGGGAQGLAWVDVMCDPVHGYGVTNVTGNTSLPSLDQEVMAHELGHNVGSYHTHNCDAYPPSGVDHCVANDGTGPCPQPWTPVQTTGTIMSYCNKRVFSFGTRVADTLKVHVDAAPCLQSLAGIQVKSDSVIFAATQIGTKRDTLLKDIIKSSGSVPLKIIGVQLIALDANDTEFTLKNPPKFPLSVASGLTQSFTVTFRPGSQGPNVGLMIFYHNAYGAADTVYLNGRGTMQQVRQIAPDVDYGYISDRNRHDTTVDLVANDGDAPLTVKKFTIDGPNASMFSYTPLQTLPFVIAPNDSTKLTVSFTAASDGVKTANLKIATDDPFTDTVSIQLSANVSGLGVADSPLPAGVTVIVLPNPTKSRVQISLDGLGGYVGSDVTAKLFDELGKQVATFYCGTLTSQSLQFSWQRPATFASGRYSLIIEAKDFRIVRTLVLE